MGMGRRCLILRRMYCSVCLKFFFPYPYSSRSSVFSPCCYPWIPYLFFLSTHRYCLGYPDICFPMTRSSTSVRPFWEGAIDAETNSESHASKPRHGHVTFLLDLCWVAFLALAVFATVLRETRV